MTDFRLKLTAGEVLQDVVAAMKYAVAFPKTTWMDLIELTPACAEK